MRLAQGVIVAGEEFFQPGEVAAGQQIEMVTQIARVFAVGPGKEDVKMEVAVGDLVIFSEYAGTKVKVDGEDVMIVSQRDILAVLQ